VTKRGAMGVYQIKGAKKRVKRFQAKLAVQQVCPGPVAPGKDRIGLTTRAYRRAGRKKGQLANIGGDVGIWGTGPAIMNTTTWIIKEERKDIRKPNVPWPQKG